MRVLMAKWMRRHRFIGVGFSRILTPEFIRGITCAPHVQHSSVDFAHTVKGLHTHEQAFAGYGGGREGNVATVHVTAELYHTGRL